MKKEITIKAATFFSYVAIPIHALISAMLIYLILSNLLKSLKLSVTVELLTRCDLAHFSWIFIVYHRDMSRPDHEPNVPA